MARAVKKKVKRTIKKKNPPWYCVELVLWCKARGERRRLAEAMNIDEANVSYWVKGTRPVPPTRCLEIARITNGAVQPSHLRPDIDWTT